MRGLLVFLDKSKSDVSTSTAKAVKRARAAGVAAASNASNAAQNAAVAAQQAANAAQVAAQQAATVAVAAAHSAGDTATGLNKQVKVQVTSARKWAAPRLENAADYTAGTVAPKVSSALRSAARQVSPADQKSKKRSVLTWSLLGAAVAAGLGAAAVLVRHRYRAAIAADSEIADEETAKGRPSTAGPDGVTQQDPNADTSVNGRVTASGW
jgi:trimeric autotransporter adhesin